MISERAKSAWSIERTCVRVCVCVLPLPSLADFAMTSKDALIHQTTTWKHTHMQKTDHYIHTQWHTHLRLYPPHQSQVPQNMISFPPLYILDEKGKKKTEVEK